MFISDVESKIEYNNLIQENNEKLAKQKSEFDQAIQALNKEIRDLEKENTSLKTECLQLKMSKEKAINNEEDFYYKKYLHTPNYCSIGLSIPCHFFDR